MKDWPRPWFEILWAPWRIHYIRQAVKERQSRDECVFCLAQRMSDEDSLILYRGKLAFIIMNKYPYNTGHLMVVPKRHVASLEELTPEEMLEMSLLVKAALLGLRRALKPHGFNIGVNIGRTAGAGIDTHVHIHIVPRWDGDANFMLVTSATKVIPQDLRETYNEIKPYIVEEASKTAKDLG